jgi:hypothetical protein
LKEYVLDILAILNERAADYGDVRVNLDRFARQWSETLETDVTPRPGRALHGATEGRQARTCTRTIRTPSATLLSTD